MYKLATQITRYFCSRLVTVLQLSILGTGGLMSSFMKQETSFVKNIVLISFLIFSIHSVVLPLTEFSNKDQVTKLLTLLGCFSLLPVIYGSVDLKRVFRNVCFAVSPVFLANFILPFVPIAILAVQNPSQVDGQQLYSPIVTAATTTFAFFINFKWYLLVAFVARVFFFQERVLVPSADSLKQTGERIDAKKALRKINSGQKANVAIPLNKNSCAKVASSKGAAAYGRNSSQSRQPSLTGVTTAMSLDEKMNSNRQKNKAIAADTIAKSETVIFIGSKN